MKLKKFFGTFLFVCALGAIVGSASGIVWGTESCGTLVAVTFLFGFVLGSGVTMLDDVI